MTFAVAAEAYERYIGRYSRELAPRFLAFAEIASGPVIDLGCGPGCLSEVLAARFGASQVGAVDTSDPFVAACRHRVPGADVRLAPVEHLPFGDHAFQSALSQLVLSFVGNADEMAAEIRRVVRPGGTAAACTFDADGFAVVRTLWDAARRFDPAAPDDAALPFRRTHELTDLWTRSGFREVQTGVIEIEATYADFEDFWSPFTFGIGPAGHYLMAQPGERRDAIRRACFELLGQPQRRFSLPARVLAVRGVL
jgi:ubiquinone/menaquinone biosynthesis C-methylase UbiE